VGVSTKNAKQVSAYGTKHRPGAPVGMTILLWNLLVIPRIVIPTEAIP
jgi:hypothetical protein